MREELHKLNDFWTKLKIKDCKNMMINMKGSHSLFSKNTFMRKID